MIVWEIIPRGTIGAVVFPHRTPGAFTQVWSPTFPVDCCAATSDFLLSHIRILLRHGVIFGKSHSHFRQLAAIDSSLGHRVIEEKKNDSMIQ